MASMVEFFWGHVVVIPPLSTARMHVMQIIEGGNIIYIQLEDTLETVHYSKYIILRNSWKILHSSLQYVLDGKCEESSHCLE